MEVEDDVDEEDVDEEDEDDGDATDEGGGAIAIELKEELEEELVEALLRDLFLDTTTAVWLSSSSLFSSSSEAKLTT